MKKYLQFFRDSSEEEPKTEQQVKSKKKKVKVDIKDKPKSKIQKQQVKKVVQEKPKIENQQPRKWWWKKGTKTKKPVVPPIPQYFDKDYDEIKKLELMEEDSDLDLTELLLQKPPKDGKDKLETKKAKPTKKFWWSKKKKEDRSTDPKQPETSVQICDDRESTEKVSDAEVSDEEIKKPAIDSDYYSTDTSTDYSYSYQDDKNKYDSVPQTPMPFKDVEKQEIPDYASMESYRGGSEDEATKKSKGTSISKTVLGKSKPERHVDFIGVPTPSEEKPKPKLKTKNKVKKKDEIKKVADDTDTDSEPEVKEETPLIGIGLRDKKVVKKKPDLLQLATEDTGTRKHESLEMITDDTDKERETELDEGSSSIEARLKEKDQPQRTKLAFVKPAICVSSESDGDIPDVNPIPVDSSLVTLPPQITTGVNTTNTDEFEKKLNEMRTVQLRDIPTLSEICTCEKIPQRFSHVQYEEINESPRTTFSSNNLTSSSLISSLSDYNSEQFLICSKKKNANRPGQSVNYVEMVYDTFPGRREMELRQRNKIRQYYKAVKDIPAKRVTSFSTPSKIRAMVEKVLQKVCCFLVRAQGGGAFPYA